jgi:hypothetical protein
MQKPWNRLTLAQCKNKVIVGRLKSWREPCSRSWGLQHVVLPPPPPGCSLYCDNHLKVEGKNQTKRGGQGDAPLGCFPLWGERGHPHALSKRMAGDRISPEKYSILFPVLPEIKPALHKNYSKNSRGKKILYSDLAFLNLPFGTIISNLAPLSGSPFSVMVIPVYPRISRMKNRPKPVPLP